MFYYTDEANLTLYLSLRAVWSPKGQEGMIPTPGQPDKYYGIGAVNYHKDADSPCEDPDTLPYANQAEERNCLI